MFDDTDLAILEILQHNARTPNADIARRVGMAASATLERVRKLEERGAILGYEARLDSAALELGLIAFLFVRTTDRPGHLETARRIAQVPEVQEVHHIAGEDCYLVKLRARDPADLGRLIRDHIGPIGSITSTRTTIVLETVKESGTMPLPK